MLKLISISPNHPDWNEYLRMSSDYVLKYWPKAQGTMSQREFEEDYGSQLKQRFAEGGRGLFFLAKNCEKIGLSNAYIEGKSLYIAEFYIREEFRRTGYGKEMVQLLIEWGKENQTNHLYVEVDKDFEGANRFWSSFHDLMLDDSGDRNVYHRDI